jgi:hypothetical protein
MQNIIEEKVVGNYTIRLMYDDGGNPINDDIASKFVCFHKRYSLGHKHDYDHRDYSDWDEMEKDIIKKENPHTILPLYLYDHSGLTISTRPFACSWDSGQIGFVYITKRKVKEIGLNQTYKNKVREILLADVKEYDMYLRGEVYLYQIIDNKSAEVIECLGGIIDAPENIMNDATSFISNFKS